MTAHTTEPASIYGSIEPLLPHVTKPIQYVGGELNAVTTPWADADVHWVLMYPDAYEVGQPNQGNAILYEVLNETGWISAERVFSVWPDLEQRMRAVGLPLLSLESHRPVKKFDVLGISLATELGYTNLLNALDLAGIQLHRRLGYILHSERTLSNAAKAFMALLDAQADLALTEGNRLPSSA